MFLMWINICGKNYNDDDDDDDDDDSLTYLRADSKTYWWEHK